jgi:signal recognition particle receptor subunit beta
MKRNIGFQAFPEIKLAIAASSSVDVLGFLQELSSYWPDSQLSECTIGLLESFCLATQFASKQATAQQFDLSLRVLSGNVHYHAMQEVLLGNADGILVLLDMEPSQRNSNMHTLLQTTQVLRQQGLELHQIPMVVQYLRADLVAADTIAEWDQLLECERHQIPRFLSMTGSRDDSAKAIDALLQRVLEVPRLTVE